MAGQGGQGRAGGRAGDFTVAFGHGHPLVESIRAKLFLEKLVSN